MKARITCLPGDGIGPEVVREARRVLEVVAAEHNHQFEFAEADIGAVAIERHGEPFPKATQDICQASTAVFLGAVGDPKFDHLPPAKKAERGLLDLRKMLGNYANLRPVAVPEALADSSPLRRDLVRGVDLLIVRELLGGIYFGSPRGVENDRAFNTEVYSREEVRRVAQIAFKLARHRRRKVTSVDKANVLESSVLWRETCTEVAKEFPDIEFQSMYVDNCAMQLIARPLQFDVILTNNMFGDILSDEASMLAGSLGLLPSASIGGSIGLYEPVHGSAPDIAGKGVANPLGAISSAAMLLEHSLELPREATKVERAIIKVLSRGYRTQDLKSRTTTREKTKDRVISTREMGELICDYIRMPDAT
jgi:3-isopropylmalate dehydrogenase